MEINVNERKRRVEIWLTRAEKDDYILRESLKLLYAEYRNKKYNVSIFLSGSNDLFTNTCSLLISNKQKLFNPSS